MLNALKLLIPALIPSWRFFDAIAASPRIEVAILATAQAQATEWREFNPRPTHISLGTMLQRLFWNPDWNETLFLVSCAERMVTTPTEHSQQEIMQRVRRASTGAAWLQFRLVFVSRDGDAIMSEVTYVSPAFPAGENAA